MQRRVDFREQYRVHVRQQILDLAHPILAAEGEEAVTMSKLAKQVGLSIGSIYRYFPSRGTLLALLWQERIGALTATLEPLVRELPPEPAAAVLVHARAWTAAAHADGAAVLKLADSLQEDADAEAPEEASTNSTSVTEPLVLALAEASQPTSDPDRARWLTAVLLRIIVAAASPPPAGLDDTFAHRTVAAVVESWTHQR